MLHPRLKRGRHQLVRLAAPLLLANLLTCSPAGQDTRPAARTQIEPRPQDLGTVATLAGPGFCPSMGSPDLESTEPKALAADATGALHYVTGPAGPRPTVVRMARDGLVSQYPLSLGDEEANQFSVAPDGAGGTILGAGGQLWHINSGGISAKLPLPAPDSGEGVSRPFAGSLAALASGDRGGLFVARHDSGNRSSILFFNRTDGPVNFYPGTPRQLTIAAGQSELIASSRRETGRDDLSLLPEGQITSVAWAPDRLYASFSPQVADRRAVTLLNLSGKSLTAHGQTVKAGSLALLSRLTGGDGGGSGRRVDSVSADSEGNLFFAQASGNIVRRLDSEGRMITVAGTGRKGFNGNDRLAVGAALNRPKAVAAGPDGIVYIADAGNGQVRFVDASGVIHAARGRGIGARTRCFSGNREAARNPAELPAAGRPWSPAWAAGKLYVTTWPAPGLIEVSRSGTAAVSFRTGGAKCPAPAPAPCLRIPKTAPALELSAPAWAAGGSRGVYVTQGTNPRIWFLNMGPAPVKVHGVSVPGGTAEPVAGSATAGFSGDAGPALKATLGRIGGALVADKKGNLFFTDSENQRVRMVDSAGRISTVAGPIVPPHQRCCRHPEGLALDRNGNLFISDPWGARVWYLNRTKSQVILWGMNVAPGELKQVAGGQPGISGDGGHASKAQMLSPTGLALDGKGNLFIADRGENSIRRVAAGGIISTVAGTGVGTFNGDGLKGRATSLRTPIGLALDQCGDLLIADADNYRLRKLKLAKPCLG